MCVVLVSNTLLFLVKLHVQHYDIMMMSCLYKMYGEYLDSNKQSDKYFAVFIFILFLNKFPVIMLLLIAFKP